MPFIDNQALIIDFVSQGLWGSQGHFERHAQGLGFGCYNQGILCGAIHHNYDTIHNSIELSCYSINNKWFTKRNLNIMLDYPFNQIKVRLLRAYIKKDNVKLIKLFNILNVSMVEIPDLFNDNENAIIATFKRTEWLKSKFCNEAMYGRISTKTTGPDKNGGRTNGNQYWNFDSTATIQ